MRAWIVCPLGLCQVKPETASASLHSLQSPCHPAHYALAEADRDGDGP